MSNHYKTTPHFVAYLDLLGGKYLIQSQENESLDKLHSLLQLAEDSCAPNSKALFPECKIKIFSDNIIFACELAGDIEESLLKINSAISLITAIQICGMEKYRYLFRGGATIGNLFLDNVMVWGNGLVKAYELECSLAIYPRIIIDNPILDMLSKDKDFSKEQYDKYNITLDFDNMYFLDYLNAYFKLPLPKEYKTEFIEENYIYYKDKLPTQVDKVRQKLSWQVLYLEKYIEINKELITNGID